MKQHTCIICIGSNHRRNLHLTLARKELSLQFPGIIFGSEQETVPLFFSNSARFSNQLAIFGTELQADRIEDVCKQIEIKAGRTPQDKAAEIVKLDIDLLIVDETLIRPDDLKREYIQKGMQEIKQLLENSPLISWKRQAK